ASREWITLLWYCASPIDASTTIIVRTMRSSMRVKPRSPVLVFRPVKCRASKGRVDVEHVLPAPPGRIGFVLVRPQPPLRGVGHRIERNPAQKFQFASGRIVGGRDAVDQLLQVRRVVLAPGFEIERADDAEIRRVLEVVDRGPHLAQVAPELGFALAPGGHLRQRHHRRRQDQHNRGDDEQLDEPIPSRVPHSQFVHCTVIVTGRNCSPIAVPPGPVAAPLSVSVTVPGPMASNSTAASSPVPDAPVASVPRDSVMSTRLGLACWLNETLAPPARMKLPSCTVGTRSLVESNVSVSVMVEIRAASLIEIGMMYGPPPTRNVVPLGDITTRAAPIPGVVIGGSFGVGGAGGCSGGVGVGVAG